MFDNSCFLQHLLSDSQVLTAFKLMHYIIVRDSLRMLQVSQSSTKRRLKLPQKLQQQ